MGLDFILDSKRLRLIAQLNYKGRADREHLIPIATSGTRISQPGTQCRPKNHTASLMRF